MTLSLSDLSSLGDEQMPSAFMDNLSGIFAYAMGDITDVLTKFTKESLGKLHKDLCSKVMDVFPHLQCRRPIKRMVVNTLAGDIVVLGYSIANNAVHRDIERVFHPPTTTDDSSDQNPSHVEELAELLKVVADLSQRVSSLEKELAELRGSSRRNEPDDDDSESSSEEAGNTNAWQPGGNSRTRKRRDRRNRQLSATLPESAPSSSAAATSVSTTDPNPPPPVPNPQPPAQNPLVPHASPPGSDTQAQPLSAALGLRAADAPAKVSIYVGNVNPNNSVKDIVQHLRNLGVARVPHVKTLSRHGAAKKSFCVQIPSQFKETALCSEKWPSNIRVRLFIPRSNSRDPPPAEMQARPREPAGRHRTPQDRYYSSPYAQRHSSYWQGDWDNRYYAWDREQQYWRDY